MKNRVFRLTALELTDTTVGASVANAANAGDEGAAASGGTYTAQRFSCTYTIEVTTAGAYGGVGEVTITGSAGGDNADRALSATFKPVSGVPFAAGTLGVTFTLTDGGDAVLTLGDKWTIPCSGEVQIIDSMMSITVAALLETRIDYLFARQLSLFNSTGGVIGINTLRDDEEYAAYIADDTNFDLIEIPNNTWMFDDFRLPQAKRLAVSLVSGAAGAPLVIQMINYT